MSTPVGMKKPPEKTGGENPLHRIQVPAERPPNTPADRPRVLHLDLLPSACGAGAGLVAGLSGERLAVVLRATEGGRHLHWGAFLVLRGFPSPFQHPKYYTNLFRCQHLVGGPPPAPPQPPPAATAPHHSPHPHHAAAPPTTPPPPPSPPRHPAPSPPRLPGTRPPAPASTARPATPPRPEPALPQPTEPGPARPPRTRRPARAWTPGPATPRSTGPSTRTGPWTAPDRASP